MEKFKDSYRVYGVKGKKGGAKRMTGFITLADVTDKYEALEKYKIFFTTTYSSDASTRGYVDPLTSISSH